MTAQAILAKLKNEGKLIKDGGNYKTADGRTLIRGYKGKSETVWIDAEKMIWYPTLLDAYQENYARLIRHHKNISF